MRVFGSLATITLFLAVTSSVSSDASIESGLGGRFYFSPTVQQRRRDEASSNAAAAASGDNRNFDTPIVSTAVDELNRKFLIDHRDFRIEDSFRDEQQRPASSSAFERNEDPLNRNERADESSSKNANSQQGLTSGARLFVKNGNNNKRTFDDRINDSSSGVSNRSTNNDGLLPRAALKAAHGDDYGLHYGLGYNGYDRFYGAVADPHYRPLGKDLLDHHTTYNLYDHHNPHHHQGHHVGKYSNYGRHYDHNPAYSWASGCFRRDGYGCKFDPWYKYGGEEYKRRYHYDKYYDLYKYARRFYPEYTAYKLRGRDALVRCSFPGANIIGDVAWYPPGRYNDNYGRYRSYASRETAIMEIRDYDQHDFGAYRCYAKVRRHYSPGHYTEYVYQDVHFYPWKDYVHDHHHYDDYDYKLSSGRNRYQERHLYD